MNIIIPFIILFFSVIHFNHIPNREKSQESESFVTSDLSIRFQHIEPIIKQSSLLAHWPLDEGSGYECRDWSGNKLTAYFTGHNWNADDSGLTSSFRKKGKRAGCIYFN